MSTSDSRLFEDENTARAILDVTGAFPLLVVSHLLELWDLYRPFADRAFQTELRDAVRRLGVYLTPGADRDAAYRDFHARYWEMYVGCSLLRRNLQFVAFAQRPSAGPDHLVSYGGQKLWIECVTVGPGSGPDRVPDYAHDGAVRDVPDEQIRLRQLAAIDEKHKKHNGWIRKGLLSADAHFVLAINDTGVPFALTDDDPPRIARTLFGLGTFAVKVDLTTNQFSEPYLIPLSSIQKSRGSLVASNGFLTGQLNSIGGVIYSRVDAWNRAGPDARDFISVLNPRASVHLDPGWFPRCVEYAVYFDGLTGRIVREDR